MKRINTILILVSLAIIFFSFDIFAQSSVTKKAFDEKANQEEIKVKLFVKSFIKSLEKTKDIGKVPNSFFVSDFRKRFAEYQDTGDIFNDLWINSKLWKNLPKSLRYEFNVLRFNFNTLPTMLVKNFDDDETTSQSYSANKDEGIVVFGEFFPPQVFKVLKQTKVLSISFDNNKEINSLSEFKLLLAEMKTVLNALRIYLNKNNLSKSDSLFSAEIQDLINQAKWSESDGFCGKCKNECRRLSKNTKYIYIGGFLLRLTIINQNGRFKIFDTPVWEDASSRFPWSPCIDK